jgi:hydroxyacylglutathione hydrolase
MAQRPQSTLGYERFCNVFMEGREERDFIDAVLGSVPEFPDYYRRMKQVNAQGPGILERLPGGTALSPDEFEEHLRRLGAVVIDLRRPEAFGGAHIPGALNIGAGQNLSMWAGWVVPYDTPILLVGDEATDLESARRSLIRVGLDDIRGWLKGGMRSWIEAGLDQAHIPQVSVRELHEKLRSQDVLLLDVRSRGEWVTGHIDRAVHIPGGELPKRASEIPKESPVHVICGSGYRSSIACSVLKRAGARHVVNVVGGMTAWNAQSLPAMAGGR